jgi:hypothetical protein
MTPQFLRAEAARFREMADSVTDREASRQRLLNMANDYEARASAAEETQPPEPHPVQEPEPDTESEPAADQAVTAQPVRTRTRRTVTRTPLSTTRQ